MEKRIYLSTPTMHGEEMSFIQEAFDRNWITPLGRNCDMFEQEISEYVSADAPVHSLCTVSGTAAIHLAVKLAGVKRGDVVLCSDLTFAASVNPVCYEGAKPVFIDCERDSWNMDPIALERAFEKYPNAKAVIVAHLYGVPAKMDKIAELCDKYNAVLIEDAAEALSATYNGKKCGTFGKYGALSFNGNKIITTSGGGMLICNTQAARDKAFFWSTQSRDNAPWYQHSEIGYNYRMSNVVAGIGRGQLLHLEEHRAAKTHIYNYYSEALKELPITMNPYPAGSKPNFWLSCILIDESSSVKPTDIISKLSDNNVEGRHIWKPMHLQPVFADCDYITADGVSIGDDVFNRGVCLPSDIKLTDDELDYVVNLVKSCF